MNRRVAVAVFAIAASLPVAAQGQGCVGSVAVTTFRLAGAPGGGNSPVWVPMRRLNNLPNGYRVRYQPGTLPQGLDNEAAMTIVMMPKAGGQVTVLQPGPVNAVSDWIAPFDAGVVLFVFAPQGLDQKRLTNLVTRDDTLIEALADYADQTAELEATLQALSEIESDEDQTPARASTPTEQALLSLVRALNPAVSSFNPLGAGRRAGPTSLMGRGANTFFENAGGVVPGGGILPSVKGWLMPDTEFRSVYASSSQNGDMTLCAQRLARGRNKLAYVWAYRFSTNAAPPATVSNEPADVPIGIRAGVPLQLNRIADWDKLERVFDWALVPENGAAQPVQARALADVRELRLDLRQFAGGPGLYRIEGRWDWDSYRVGGSVRLHRLDNLGNASLAPESQDKLVANTGLVALDLTGANLKFVERAWIHRPESERQIAVDLPAARPAVDRLRVETDTDGLRPGAYLLALERVDGARADLPFVLHPAPPKIEGPARVNIGERQQIVTFRGTDLDRLERLESERADIQLRAPGEDRSQREAVVTVRTGAQAGDRVDISAKVQGMNTPIRFPGALQIAGARPRIVESKSSLPADLAATPREGEIPAGSFVSFSLRLDPPNINPIMTLRCAEEGRTAQEIKLATGERRANAQLTSAGGGSLFLSLDPGAVGSSGCTLTAKIETETLGASDPFTLGKVVRLPRIDALKLSNEALAGGFAGSLDGWDLESIERTGWSANNGLPVTDLPRPIAGEGAKQTLRIAVPWPAPTPKAPLFIWLRGETEGRATRISP